MGSKLNGPKVWVRTETERVLSIQPMLYGVKDAATATSLGRTKIYELMDSGELPSVKVGTRRLIPREALEEFAARLVANQVAS